jgi:hypothetical protein
VPACVFQCLINVVLFISAKGEEEAFIEDGRDWIERASFQSRKYIYIYIKYYFSFLMPIY